MTIPPEQAEAAEDLGRRTGATAHETHISAVFKGAETVFKMKKAVRLGFLDFTDRATRRRLLHREVELNSPYAPGLYLDVMTVAGNEPVLRMARAPDDAFLDARAAAGPLAPALLDALADAVAAMHAAQPPAPGPDPAVRLADLADANAQVARDAGLAESAVAAWHVAMRHAVERAAPALRARGPLVRRAHGDLHLGNILVWNGQPCPFDALEFDEGLATIDPGYDLAFLLMDLDLKAGRAAANRVLNRYVARTGDAGLVGPLAPFLSLRAMIRAHVQAASLHPHQALLDAAGAYLRPGRAMLLGVGGLMGAGKSTLARALAPGLGPAPGALLLRSDEVRKRLHGVSPEDRLPPAGYGAEAGARTNAALLAAARTALDAGHAAIIDATFMAHPFAAATEAVARVAGVPFLGLWLDAPLEHLERRIAARRDDASDATVEILWRAAPHAGPPPGWTVVDAVDADAAVRAAQHHVQARLEML